MHLNATRTDRWMRIVGALLLAADEQKSASILAAQATRNASCTSSAGISFETESTWTARVIERRDCASVLVAWSDATSCRYGEQHWVSGVAQRSSVCALSGTPIKPGEAVYKPKPARMRPLNADAMILSWAVNARASFNNIGGIDLLN